MFELRPFQKQALEELKTPGNVLCIAPTGSGKSLIYERYIQEYRPRSILLTPLVALARQQKRKLEALGLLDEIRILSPESLLFSNFVQKLKAWKPTFLVVDECHCLWEWGEDFRPAFQKIPEIFHEFSIQKSLWLTATLPGLAKEFLKKSLSSPFKEVGGFELPQSLYLTVQKISWTERTFALLNWIGKHPDSGIVFVSTREETLRISRLLSSQGHAVQPYHAGMSKEERLSIENRVMQQKIKVIVATSAFGMGMDYPHLNWVLLWQAPPSLLALTQCIGRVGRGTRLDYATVFWDEEDFRLLEWMTKDSKRKKRELYNTYLFLKTNACRRKGLTEYFRNAQSENCVSLCEFCVGKK